MKVYILAAALAALPLAAQASDLPSKKAPVAVPVAARAVDNWTGPYMGIVGGYGWGTSDYTSADINGSIDSTGWTVGGQIGYDMLVSNNFVVGVAADYSWANLTGDSYVETNNDPSHPSYANAHIDSLATARVRAGFAADNLLIYATGGFAYAATKVDVTALAGSADNYADWSDSKNAMGWVIGGGLEYKVAKNLSFGVEYLHVNLGSETYALSNGANILPAYDVKADTTVDLVRGALNYRF